MKCPVTKLSTLTSHKWLGVAIENLEIAEKYGNAINELESH